MLDGGGSGRGLESVADFGEVGDHAGALRGVGKQGTKS
jgi:hypothetical protein